MTRVKPTVEWFSARIPLQLKRDVDERAGRLGLSMQEVAIEALTSWLGKEPRKTRIDKKLSLAIENFLLNPQNESDQILGKALVLLLKRYSDASTAIDSD